MDKLLKHIEKHKLPKVKTLTGVVAVTIKLCKKYYKKKCTRTLIKDTLAVILDTYIKNKELPQPVEDVINTISEEDIYDLIDDLYDTQNCLNDLKSMFCKTKQLSVSEPVKVSAV